MLVFIAHDRRELVHVNVTANPTAAWVWRQLIEATPWGDKPRHLLRDRDAAYGRDFRQRARRIEQPLRHLGESARHRDRHQSPTMHWAGRPRSPKMGKQR